MVAIVAVVVAMAVVITVAGGCVGVVDPLAVWLVMRTVRAAAESID